MDVFESARTLSPLGTQHEIDESASEAVARRIAVALFGAEPGVDAKRIGAWSLRLVKSCAIASAFSTICADDTRRALHGGLWMGTALWLVGDELALPLLGLRDKPTAYHPTQHLQSLAQELAFGMAAAATTHALEASR